MTDTKNKIAISTIITSNYLNYAMTLYDSAKEHFDRDFIFNIYVVNKIKDKPNLGDNINIFTIQDVEKHTSIAKEIHKKYEGDRKSELRWALKPSIMEHSLKYSDLCIFCDPDIAFTSSPTEHLDKFINSSKDIFLTPNAWTKTMHNIRSMRSGGIYNAGFIMVKGTDEGKTFLKFWSRCCFEDCRISSSDFLFVDQKHLDLMPTYFNCLINKDKRINVSNNTEGFNSDAFTVDRKPVVCYHYHSFNADVMIKYDYYNKYMEQVKNRAHYNDLIIDRSPYSRAKILDDRQKLMEVLPHGGTVVELGVFQGGFSEDIFLQNKPKDLYLVDCWNYHYNGTDPNDNMRIVTSKFKFCENVHVVQSDSIEFLKKNKNKFNIIYIDTVHSYQFTMAELEEARTSIVDDGYICLHDFHFLHENCWTGVMKAVYDFCDKYNFYIKYVTLDINEYPSCCICREGTNDN